MGITWNIRNYLLCLLSQIASPTDTASLAGVIWWAKSKQGRDILVSLT